MSKAPHMTRGERGFEYGVTETLQSQDLADGVYEYPRTIEATSSRNVCCLFLINPFLLTLINPEQRAQRPVATKGQKSTKSLQDLTRPSSQTSSNQPQHPTHHSVQRVEEQPPREQQHNFVGGCACSDR